MSPSFRRRSSRGLHRRDKKLLRRDTAIIKLAPEGANGWLFQAFQAAKPALEPCRPRRTAAACRSSCARSASHTRAPAGAGSPWVRRLTFCWEPGARACGTFVLRARTGWNESPALLWTRIPLYMRGRPSRTGW
jgi:hypothetical protein